MHFSKKLTKADNIEKVIFIENEYKILKQQNWERIKLTPYEYFETINKIAKSKSANFSAINQMCHF